MAEVQKAVRRKRFSLAAYDEPAGLSLATFPKLRVFVAELKAAVPGMHVESLAGTPFGEGILDLENPSAAKLRRLMTGYLGQRRPPHRGGDLPVARRRIRRRRRGAAQSQPSTR
ncbi:MAG: hypothetical protein QM811_22640 [Pirellulales bacterium]